MIYDLSIAIPLAAICVVISAFCSGSEVALFSLRRTDREQLAHSNHSYDRRILRLLERPRRLIATVLIGSQAFNSLLVITSLAVVIYLAPELSLWLCAGIALGVSLPLVVLIAEVTAKTLAAKAPLGWARACAAPLQLFALLITPVRVVLQTMSSILLRPLGEGVRNRPVRDLSELEFRTLVDAGSAQGQVDARERRLIHRVFEFSDKNVGQVMTPRERIFALSYDLPVQRIVKELAARGFSRVPIYQKSLDNVRGILNAKDLVRTAGGRPLGRPLGEVLHEPLFVPRTTPVKRLFLTFKQKKVHMAIVVSEYGKVLGLVTMDDLLSQIFGVLRDERAELQNSIPPGRIRVRTGADGNPQIEMGREVLPIPIAAADPSDAADAIIDGDGSPVPRDLAAVRRAPTGGDTGPVPLEHDGFNDGDSSPGTPRMPLPMDPLPPPGLRPIHPVDEVTPPATDIAELRAAAAAAQASGFGKGDKS